LATAATPREVGEAIFARGLALLKAAAGVIVVRDGDQVHVAASMGMSEPGDARHRAMRLDAPLPITEAIRTGRSVWLRSPEEAKARFPQFRAAVDASPYRAWNCLPLRAGGRTVGGLGLGYYEEVSFSLEERRFFEAAADLCGQALERARLYEAER